MFLAEWGDWSEIDFIDLTDAKVCVCYVLSVCVCAVCNYLQSDCLLCAFFNEIELKPLLNMLHTLHK